MKLVAKAPVILACLTVCCSVPVIADTEALSIPAIYVFGDSLVDVGNNQYLPGNKVQFPYGIDFPNSTVTGRFTNGYNLADTIAQQLGFKMSPPAYLSLKPETSHDLLNGLVGANYASGGSGILDTTGSATISLSLGKQIENFTATKAKMSANLDPKTLENLLSKSLFLLSSGGNDFFQFIAQKKSAIEAPFYFGNMVFTYIKHIRELYKLGARRIGILNVPPIGCVPGARASTSNGACSVDANYIAKFFNGLLRFELFKAAITMPGLKYSIGNTYSILSHYINHPETAGFKEVRSACCGEGRFNIEIKCSPNTTYCANRSEYVFWDPVHATQATYEKGAVAICSGPKQYADPINFNELVRDGGH